MGNYIEVYRDEKYLFFTEDGLPYMIIKGEKYKLTCHPYEPCLYITDTSGRMTAVHNSFDPIDVVESFENGKTVTSITGLEYGAKDFCMMVEYAAGAVDIQIDEAERVFGARVKRETIKREKENPFKDDPPIKEESAVIENDPFYEVAAAYPDSVIDYCLVANDHTEAHGYNAHRSALLSACRKLFVDEDGETIWHYDIEKADAKQIGADELFAPADKEGELNYRKAFLYPPYTCGYTDGDFDAINAALFPRGTEGLEVCRWTTDWSEYFDEGHEWWGTLCLTVYDEKLDRFAVIMASATD